MSPPCPADLPGEPQSQAVQGTGRERLKLPRTRVWLGF